MTDLQLMREGERGGERKDTPGNQREGGKVGNRDEEREKPLRKASATFRTISHPRYSSYSGRSRSASNTSALVEVDHQIR